MSDTFVWMAVFAVLSAVINAAGIFAIVKYRKWAEKPKPILCVLPPAY